MPYHTQEQVEEMLKEKWQSYYGEAPEGTVKFNRSNEILTFWLFKIFSLRAQDKEANRREMVEEIRNYPRLLMSTMPKGNLPFVIFGGKADEDEKRTIYIQAINDVAGYLSTLIHESSNEEK